MDHQAQLKEYIRHQLDAGQSPDEIAAQLTHAGWHQEMIHEGFRSVQNEIMPSEYPTQASPVSSTDQENVQNPTNWQDTYREPIAVPAANGRKRGRIKTGWLLFKQAFNVLIGNKYLLRYLLMTGLWVFLITAFMFAVYFVLDTQLYDANSPDEYAYTNPFGFVILFCNYLLVYFAINYYAAGLTANVLDIFQGRRLEYRDYMKVARSKVGPLFFFSLIGATVGVLLQYIAERVRWVGWLISWLLGALWSLGTLFVVPIIVTSDRGAPSSIKESVKFFKSTWGENIVAKASVNVPLFFIQLSLIFVFIPLAFVASAVTQSIVAFIVVFVLYILCSLTVAIIGSFANSLINIALFYFAAYRQVPPAFSAELLNSVFIPKKPNRLLAKLRGSSDKA